MYHPENRDVAIRNASAALLTTLRLKANLEYLIDALNDNDGVTASRWLRHAVIDCWETRAHISTTEAVFSPTTHPDNGELTARITD